MLTVRRRLIIVFLLLGLYFCVMFIRLAYVQLVTGDDILLQAEELWTRDIPFQSERGRIVDRNGDVLVDNTIAPSLVVVPRQIEDAEVATRELARLIDIDEEKLYDHLTKEVSVEMIHPEGRKLSREQTDAIRTLNLPGIYLAEDSIRHYPYGTLLSHVLGFTGIDNQGLAGLEATYDEELSGKNGALSFFSDAKGRRLNDRSNRYTSPEDGYELSLTIDREIQEIVERELDQAVAKYEPDGALAIVMDPNNGEILSMATRPTFHPNEYQSVTPEVYNQNLPVFSTFEPGSTFKIITLAAALEEGLVDLENDTFFDKGYVEVGGARLRCWHKGGHGEQTFLEVVEHSCNPGFVHLGQKLGKERLFTYIRNFGFGSKTGIDLEGESSGILFQDEQVGPIELATTAFGQGVSVTPIQQVTAVAATINGGYLYEPYVVKGLYDPQTNEPIMERSPSLVDQVISKETSEELRFALENVVANGTGRSAYVDGYRVGGKTGTAQKVGPDGRYLENDHIVSFLGFAPADKPEYVVYVAIDNPKNTVQFGGVVSGPIVGSIIEDIVHVKELPPREGGLDKDYQWPEAPPVTVPDLIGETEQELNHYLLHLNLEVHGEGDSVISQSPESGTKVESGSTIRVFMGD